MLQEVLGPGKVGAEKRKSGGDEEQALQEREEQPNDSQHEQSPSS